MPETLEPSVCLAGDLAAQVEQACVENVVSAYKTDVALRARNVALYEWQSDASDNMRILVWVVVLSGIASSRRVEVWQDARTLWADAVAKAPGNARAWNNLGQAHTMAHDRVRARAAFLEALRLDPDNSTARRNLAQLAVSFD